MEHMGCEDMVINCTGRSFSSIARLFKDTSERLPVSCRLQIGSYTCGNYFIVLLNRLERGYLAESLDAYDLVVPVLSEAKLDEFRPYMESHAIRDAQNIVVNDFGMLHLFSGKQKVRLGRLLFRDYRDHRYPAHEEDCRSKSGALTEALQELGYAFTAIESDILSADYRIELKTANVYYHFPYRQVSCAHICEFASIGKAVEDKFVPDDTCAFQCFDFMIQHRDEYLKVGRNVFDMVPESWLSAVNRLRIIYTPGW